MLATVVVCIVASVLLWYKRKPDFIPSPWGMPLIGHLPFINLRAPHLTFNTWTKKYGAIFKVNMGGQELLVVNGFENIKQMLGSAACNYRPDMFCINQYRQNGGFGFSEPCTCWKSLRKATFKGIRSYGHGMFRVNAILNKITEHTMDRFHAQQESGAFNPWSSIYHYALHSITAFALGENFTPTEEVYRLVEYMDVISLKVLSPVGASATLNAAPWLRHFGHPVWRYCKESVKARNHLWELVEPSLLESEAASIAKQYLQAQRENPLIDDVRVKVAVGDLMIAGTVTTTVSMYCLLQLLAHHQQKQQRLHQEIEDVLCSESVIDVSDLSRMPYMHATLLELQRYVTVTPLGLPHCAGQQTTLAEHTIEKGTDIVANIWGVHRDPTFWSEPDVFKPERFLQDDGNLLPVDHPKRRRILAFGKGPRLCPGEHFAQGRIFIFFAALLKKYSIDIAAESASVPYDPATFSLNGAVEPNQYKITCTKRGVNIEE